MISCIMTAYNAEKYISQAIESIVNQTYGNWELIIIDDGSTDDTFEKCRDYRRKCVRIRYWLVNENGGHTKALNHGLKMSKGDIIAWMDSDDISELNRFEEQLKCIENGADIVTTHGISINETGDRIKNAYTDNYQRRTQPEIKIHLESDCWIMMPSMMWKREVTDRIGGFDEECIFAQDLNMFQRALDAGFRWDKCEMELYRLRRHNGSVRKTDKRSRERNWHQYALERSRLFPIVNL